uniref:Metal-dependent phosphohydrolase HD domain-containing protein n=1 Tax=Solanum tuberosum TaxID=4113 RepID=M0ZIA0_SOLTU
MGAFSNEELSFSSNFNFASSQDLRFSKQIHDNVHGNIYIDPLYLKFIDTEQFQRQVSLSCTSSSVVVVVDLSLLHADCKYMLRDLKQLGVAHMVYPGAVHSRFEHSLGVYWLANEAVHKLKTHQVSDMECLVHGLLFLMQNNEPSIPLWLNFSGLLHDIGHGPFSHLFEREFLPQVRNGLDWSHEQMSVDMIDHIVDERRIDIDSGTIKKVKDMILASSKFTLTKSSREKQFLYDIVANGRNGIDVDKFDYIVRDSRACAVGCNFQFERLMETMRVLGDEICYRAKDYLTIHKLFATRADLHRTVYTHAKVKAIELMIVDALVKANDYLHISSHIEHPSQYWKLDDTILKTIETAPDPELKESRDLILRVRRRDLYQFCNEYVVPRDKIEHFKDVTAHDIVCSQKSSGEILNEEDVAVTNVRIDLTRGKHNPLERFVKMGHPMQFLHLHEISLSIPLLHFYRHSEPFNLFSLYAGWTCCLCQYPFFQGTDYGFYKFEHQNLFNYFSCLHFIFPDLTPNDLIEIKDYESDEKFSIPDDRISHLLPSSYQDMIVRVYSKKPHLVEAISDAFENFQLKTYGIKAQVHATPEKKKRRV